MRAPLIGYLLPLVACAVGCAASSTPHTTAPQRVTSWGDTDLLDIVTLCATGTSESWSIRPADREEYGTNTGACLGKEARGFHLISQLSAPHLPGGREEVHVWIHANGGLSQAQVRTSDSIERYYYHAGQTRISHHGDAAIVEGKAWPDLSQHLYLQSVAFRLGLASGDQAVAWIGSSVDESARRARVPLGLDLTRPVSKAVEVQGGAFVWDVEGTDLRSVYVTNVRLRSGELWATALDDAVPAPPFPEIPKPTYIPNDGLDILPVEIAGDSSHPRLAAELVLPKDRTGPVPTIVFFSGSGPQNRYGFVPGTSIDIGSHEVHDTIALAGFGVLRFDDRGVGDSELGNTATPGYLALVDDARRAIATAAARPEVDNDHIILMGHSLGALTALILANERVARSQGRPSAVVLMAGAGRNLREVIYDQVSANLTEPSEREAALAEAREMHDNVMNDGPLPASSEPVRMWMKEVFGYEPATLLRKVRAPVLVLQGGRDFQVHPEHDFQALSSALNRSRGSASRRFDDLDHLFKTEPGRSTIGHYGDLTRHVNPEFLSYLVSWLQSLPR